MSLFFSWFSNKHKQSELLDRIKYLSPAEISVLLFIRDPVEHCCSSYQQTVKRHSSSSSILQYMATYSVPARVHAALRFCEDIGAELTVFNYSVERKNIVDLTASWLGVDLEMLSRPPVDVVNRSMSRSEIALLLAVNKHCDGDSGRILADALCNTCPDIKADDMRPDVEAQHELWNRMKEHIEFVNRKIPPEAYYDRERDIRPTGDKLVTGEFRFTADQLEVIGQQFASIRGRARKNIVKE